MSLKTTLMQMLGKSRSRAVADAGPSSTVSPLGTLHVSENSAHLVYATGGDHKLKMAGMAAGLQLTTESVVAPGVAPTSAVVQFGLEDGPRARAAFDAQVAQWRATLVADTGGGAAGVRAASARKWLWTFPAGFAAGAAAVILAAIVIAPPPAGSQVAQAGQPASSGAQQGQYAMNGGNIQLLPPPPMVTGGAGQMPPRAERTVPPVEDMPASGAATGGVRDVTKLTQAERDAIAKATRLVVKPGKEMLVAFSDPLCPGCQDLERESQKMGERFGVTVIPVAFQRGSRALVASVLCSADPAKAWGKAMVGDRPSEAPCDKGLAAVDANMNLFARLGANQTPTVVLPNGAIVAGALPAPQMEQLVMAYSK